MPRKQDPEREIRGSVRATNISPKGAVEGVLLETEGGIVQLNFPKHDQGPLPASYAVGARVTVQARLESEEFEHPVFELAPTERTVEGVIARLNYARHGEINGFHFEDGTFVHLTPDVASEYDLEVGLSAAVSGPRKTGEAATVIDARRVALRGSPRRARTG